MMSGYFVGYFIGAAGAGLQFVFGLGEMSGPFLCSIFMDLVGSNGFFIF